MRAPRPGDASELGRPHSSCAGALISAGFALKDLRGPEARHLRGWERVRERPEAGVPGAYRAHGPKGSGAGRPRPSADARCRRRGSERGADPHACVRRAPTRPGGHAEGRGGLVNRRHEGVWTSA